MLPNTFASSQWSLEAPSAAYGIRAHPSQAGSYCRRSGGSAISPRTGHACNAGGDESVVELLIPRPVVPNLGQPVHPHHDHKTEVGLQLLYAGLPCSIPICSSK